MLSFGNGVEGARFVPETSGQAQSADRVPLTIPSRKRLLTSPYRTTDPGRFDGDRAAITIVFVALASRSHSGHFEHTVFGEHDHSTLTVSGIRGAGVFAFE